jgi:hypothetical protein
MAEPMNMTRDENVANPRLDTGMPKEAKDVMMKPSEGIKNALLMRLSNMTPDELRMLDEAITPKVASVLMKLLPEMQELIAMVEQSGVGDAMEEDQMMPAEMGALGNM